MAFLPAKSTRLCRGLHAEQNAIIKPAYHGVSIRESSLYVTCIIRIRDYAKMIINAGVKKVTISESYPNAGDCTGRRRQRWSYPVLRIKG